MFVAQASQARSLISAEQVNQAALKSLLSNAAVMKTDANESVASLLSRNVLTSGDTHNKISNSCSFDKNDEMYNCSLTITNADDKAIGRTESMTRINYQLEAGKDGMPGQPLFLNVEVLQAG